MKDTLPKFGDSVILKVGANVGFREGLNDGEAVLGFEDFDGA